MTRELPTGGVRYAEKKVAFFEAEAEEWLKDHREAQACQDCEAFIRDLNILLGDIRKAEHDLQAAYFDGLPFDAEMNGRVLALFRRWLHIAQEISDWADEFAQVGYAVDGLRDLRKGIAETAAMLDPAEEVGGWIAELEQRAIADNQAGRTTPGLVD